MNDADRLSGSDMANVDSSDDPQARVRYLDNAAEQFIEMKIDSYSLLGINGGDRVLDVGCGTGDDVRRMAEIVGSFGRVVGVDLSETMVEQARERSECTDLPVEFVGADAYDLPFPDDSFDACRCERVLLHLDEPLRAIREMMRVTRSGGRILLLDPDFGATLADTSLPEIHERVQAFQQQRRRTLPGDGWRGRQLWGLAHEAGLENVQVDGGVLITTSFAAADAVAGFSQRLEEAVAAGAITREEADAYLADLKERDATSRFFGAAPRFTVVGTKPE